MRLGGSSIQGTTICKSCHLWLCTECKLNFWVKRLRIWHVENLRCTLRLSVWYTLRLYGTYWFCLRILVAQTFAYVDIEVASEDDVKKCVSVYSGSKWKGFTLSIQEARPSFMQRLQEEREKVVKRVYDYWHMETRLLHLWTLVTYLSVVELRLRRSWGRSMFHSLPHIFLCLVECNLIEISVSIRKTRSDAPSN